MLSFLFVGFELREILSVAAIALSSYFYCKILRINVQLPKFEVWAEGVQVPRVYFELLYNSTKPVFGMRTSSFYFTGSREGDLLTRRGQPKNISVFESSRIRLVLIHRHREDERLAWVRNSNREPEWGARDSRHLLPLR